MRHTPQERCSLISDPLVQCSLNRRSDALANKSARGSRSVRLSTLTTVKNKVIASLDSLVIKRLSETSLKYKNLY